MKPYYINYENLYLGYTSADSKTGEWIAQMEEAAGQISINANSGYLTGKTGEAIKSYLDEVHGSILMTIKQAMQEYIARFTLYKDGLYQIDSDVSAVLSKNSLNLWVESHEQNNRDITGNAGDINLELQKVSDIVASAGVSETDITMAHQQAVTMIRELDALVEPHEEAYTGGFENIDALIESAKSMIAHYKGGMAGTFHYKAGSIQDLDGFQTAREAIGSSVSYLNAEAADITAAAVRNEDWDGQFQELWSKKVGNRSSNNLFDKISSARYGIKHGSSTIGIAEDMMHLVSGNPFPLMMRFTGKGEKAEISHLVTDDTWYEGGKIAGSAADVVIGAVGMASGVGSILGAFTAGGGTAGFIMSGAGVGSILTSQVAAVSVPALATGAVSTSVGAAASLAGFGNLPDNIQALVSDGSHIVEKTVKTGKPGRPKTVKELKPNTEYTTSNGSQYVTDSKGRIKKVSTDTLELGDGKRNLYAQRTVGGKDRLPSDDGGHLVGTQFKGSGDIDNLVPQSRSINRSGGEWYSMETEWSTALKNGKSVNNVKVELKYSGNSQRPSSFKVSYQIDGELPVVRRIQNK